MRPGLITSSTMKHSGHQTSKALESFLDWRTPRAASNFTSFQARQSSDGPESGIFSDWTQIPKCPGSTSVTRRRSGSQNNLFSKLVNRVLMSEYIDRPFSQRPPQDSDIPRIS